MSNHLAMVSNRVAAILGTRQVLLQQPWAIWGHLKLLDVLLQYLQTAACVS